MLYKYRIQIALVLLFVLSIFLCVNFGYTGCRDGWGSSSIGKRGACSHHGGVTSNTFFLLMLSSVTSIFVYFFIESKYRVYANLIVLNSLPPHPLEAELKSTKQFICYILPTNEAKSKKEFDCLYCKSSFNVGTVYKYYLKGSKRVKYCTNCAGKLYEINSEILAAEKAYNELRVDQNEKIYKYYLEHSKANLS